MLKMPKNKAIRYKHPLLFGFDWCFPANKADVLCV